jgi:hypothetical protein
MIKLVEKKKMQKRVKIFITVIFGLNFLSSFNFM